MRRQIDKTWVHAMLFALFFFLAPPCVKGQQDFDLEVTVQQPGPVRGGETFSYTATVRNTGPTNAPDVILVNEPSLGTIRFAHPSVGSCDRPTHCKLGDLASNAEVTIVFGVQMYDLDADATSLLGDLPMDYQGPVNAPSGNPAIKLPANESPTTEIATLYVSSAKTESNNENNNISVRMVVRASANRAPEVEIISPRENEVLTRPAKRRTNFTMTIRAVDPDGAIDRVVVKERNFQFTRIVEGGEDKFLYRGKTYTAKELESILQANGAEERLARRTGKDTFVYTLTDPDYGPTSIFVEAHDNMGRSSFRNVIFSVEGDATVEIVSPKRKEVFEPGSTVVVEIVSKLNEGKLKEIELVRIGNTAHLSPQLVSKQGNVYRHRFVWKTDPAATGYGNLRAMIVEDSGAIRNSEQINFIIRKRPVISITSLRDGDVFSFRDTIRIAFTAINAEPGQEFTVMVDGKNVGSIYSDELIWRDLRPGIHVVQVVARHDDVELSRSDPVTIRVK